MARQQTFGPRWFYACKRLQGALRISPKQTSRNEKREHSPRSCLQRYRVSGSYFLLPAACRNSKQTQTRQHHGVGLWFGDRSGLLIQRHRDLAPANLVHRRTTIPRVNTKEETASEIARRHTQGGRITSMQVAGGEAGTDVEIRADVGGSDFVSVAVLVRRTSAVANCSRSENARKQGSTGQDVGRKVAVKVDAATPAAGYNHRNRAAREGPPAIDGRSSLESKTDTVREVPVDEIDRRAGLQTSRTAGVGNVTGIATGGIAVGQRLRNGRSRSGSKDEWKGKSRDTGCE
jgi:hypothetical protein